MKRLLFPFALILILTACIQPIEEVIYNNTPADIWISFPESGDGPEKGLLLKSGEKIVLDDRFHIPDRIVVFFYCNSTEMAYSVGSQAMYHDSFLQVEPDGRIYILGRDDFPAKTFPCQPEGYPLLPVSIKSR